MAEMETKIGHEALVDAIRLVLSREGVAEPIGRIEAELMAEADLRGVPSHHPAPVAPSPEAVFSQAGGLTSSDKRLF
jgi:hypothetical protein